MPLLDPLAAALAARSALRFCFARDDISSDLMCEKEGGGG